MKTFPMKLEEGLGGKTQYKTLREKVFLKCCFESFVCVHSFNTNRVLR